MNSFNPSNTYLSEELVTDFKARYPLLPRTGFKIKAACFYDTSFSSYHKKKSENSIKQLFAMINDFFALPSLKTKVEVVLEQVIPIEGININTTQEVIDVLKIQGCHITRSENIFVYIGMYDNDSLYGKVPDGGIGKCNSESCTGICSKKTSDRIIVVEWVNAFTTALTISHEIGHLLGMEHDFDGTRLLPKPKYSYENVTECDGKSCACNEDSGIMNFIQRTFICIHCFFIVKI